MEENNVVEEMDNEELMEYEDESGDSVGVVIAKVIAVAAVGVGGYLIGSFREKRRKETEVQATVRILRDKDPDLAKEVEEAISQENEGKAPFWKRNKKYVEVKK